jgi:hypothetical protein
MLGSSLSSALEESGDVISRFEKRPHFVLTVSNLKNCVMCLSNMTQKSLLLFSLGKVDKYLSTP